MDSSTACFGESGFPFSLFKTIGLVPKDDVSHLALTIDKPIPLATFQELKTKCQVSTVGFTDRPRQVDLSIRKSWWTSDVFFNDNFLSQLHAYAHRVYERQVDLSFKNLLLYEQDGGFETHVDQNASNSLGRLVIDIPVEGGCKYIYKKGFYVEEVDGSRPHVRQIPVATPHSIDMKQGNRICLVFHVTRDTRVSDTIMKLENDVIRIQARLDKLEQDKRLRYSVPRERPSEQYFVPMAPNPQPSYQPQFGFGPFGPSSTTEPPDRFGFGGPRHIPPGPVSPGGLLD